MLLKTRGQMLMSECENSVLLVFPAPQMKHSSHFPNVESVEGSQSLTSFIYLFNSK